jgi:hypothetical protein
MDISTGFMKALDELRVVAHGSNLSTGEVEAGRL